MKLFLQAKMFAYSSDVARHTERSKKNPQLRLRILNHKDYLFFIYYLICIFLVVIPCGVSIFNRYKPFAISPTYMT